MRNEAEVRHSRELRCQELIELVTDYLERAMIPADRMCFEQHLAYCEGCSNYLAEMHKTIKVAGTLREEWITPAAKAQLLAAFRNWKSGSRT
jgi:hypothetical protein